MLETILAIGEKLPGTTSDIKWDHHVCLNVCDKMYFITTPDANPINASVKVSDEDFDDYLEKEGVRKAPYLGRYKWIEIDDIHRFSVCEWESILSEAHQLIETKLSAKKRKELGFEN
jgi:predicted DNA-binding protein (MmcQ/YjbR family)